MGLPAPAAEATALVTGASSGLGAEFARQLAARGHGVALVARREDRLAELAATLRAAHGVRAETLACDLTDSDARGALPARIAERGLRVDVLVSNAGFATGGPFETVPLEREIEQVRLLVEVPVALAGLFYPAMVARASGAIIFVASTAGMAPLPYSAGYSAAKAHALAFAEALHTEARGRGVTVTALCPGPVRTELFDKNSHPVERLPSPAWLDAPPVVRAGLDGAAARKRVVVPGLQVRAGAPFMRFSPRWLQLRVTERVFR